MENSPTTTSVTTPTAEPANAPGVQPKTTNHELRTEKVDESPIALLTRLQSRWTELPRLALRDFQVAIATALTDSTPVGMANGALTVEMPAEFCAAAAADPNLHQRLTTLVSGLAGRTLVILLKPRATGNGNELSQRYRAAAEHPLVKELLKRFEADVLAREIVSEQRPR